MKKKSSGIAIGMSCLLMMFGIVTNALILQRCKDFTGPGLFDLDELKVSPDPVVSGQNATSHIVGKLLQDLDDTVTVSGTMQYLFLSIPIPKRSICNYLSECPISAGPVDRTETETIDENIPSGTYTGRIDISRDDKILDCFDLEVQVQ
jgi:hypothetical protein